MIASIIDFNCLVTFDMFTLSSHFVINWVVRLLPNVVVRFFTSAFWPNNLKLEFLIMLTSHAVVETTKNGVVVIFWIIGVD